MKIRLTLADEEVEARPKVEKEIQKKRELKPKVDKEITSEVTLTHKKKRGRPPKKKKPRVSSEIICKICKQGVHGELLMLCDSCDDGYHTYCLDPPMPKVITGPYICDKCNK